MRVIEAMKETNSNPTQESTLAVSLTVGQLKALIREEVEKPVGRNGQADDRLLDAEQLAQRLNVPVSWIYEQSRMGNIPTIRLGRYIRFKLHEVLSCETKD